MSVYLLTSGVITIMETMLRENMQSGDGSEAFGSIKYV